MRATAGDESERLTFTVLSDRPGSTLADDARAGLLAPPRAIPPKYLYDARGAELFDRICDLPEYYLTRREEEILRASAVDLVARAGTDAILELGSGATRKTRALLDALVAQSRRPIYVPVDISEEILRRTATSLVRDYPTLRVHGAIGDYERDLARLPRIDGRRLVVFLGSTIGNLSEARAQLLLARLQRALAPTERILIGVDLIKDERILHAAYGDAAGVTAEFNRNVLRVVNRELDADFDPEAFEHVAFFRREHSRIEMHLRARRRMDVRIGLLGARIQIAKGEQIHTENSRKFTRQSVATLLASSGFQIERWVTSSDGWFGLALAGPRS